VDSTGHAVRTWISREAYKNENLVVVTCAVRNYPSVQRARDESRRDLTQTSSFLAWATLGAYALKSGERGTPRLRKKSSEALEAARLIREANWYETDARRGARITQKDVADVSPTVEPSGGRLVNRDQKEEGADVCLADLVKGRAIEADPQADLS